MPDSASALALVLERPRHLVPHEIPLPAVGDDDAVVRVEACVAGERDDAPSVQGVVTP